MSLPSQIGDENGTTLVELMVALMAGLVILSALTMVILTTLHGSSRISARVHATQSARLGMTKLMQELHSACVTPEIAPVRTGSTGSSLQFIHQTGSAVSPTPVYSEVNFSGGSLIQQDYSVTGTSPNWSKGAAVGSPRALLEDVAPLAPSSTIFTYYSYKGGTVSETPLTVPLSVEGAALAVEVHAALSAAPSTTPVADAGSDAAIQDTATLRLTPPSFNEGSPARPCQ